MEFSIKSGSPERIRAGCIIVGVFEPRKLTTAAAALDRATRGQLSAALKRGDMDGKPGATLMLHQLPRIAAARVLLVGLGRERDFDDGKFRSAVGKAIAALKQTGVTDAVLCLSASVKQRDLAWRAAQSAIAATDATYRFEPHEKQAGSRARRAATHAARSGARGTRGRAGRAQAGGRHRARHEPRQAIWATCPATSARRPISAERREEARQAVPDVKRARCSSARRWRSSAWARSSRSRRARDEPPRFIVLRLRRRRRRAQAPVVLVGKGITFDTGGISLKPARRDGRDEVRHVRRRQRARHAARGRRAEAAGQRGRRRSRRARTCPAARAIKPGDIVTSMSGQTIEILNTDAEGRLILCDALTYAERFKPAAVVDIATLTGACVIALGHVASGLFTQRRRARARRCSRPADDACDRVLAHAAGRRIPGAARRATSPTSPTSAAAPAAASRRRVPVALHAKIRLGAPRHRRHRLEDRARPRARPAGRCRCSRSS